ncbi:MAG: hypothetical protein ACLSXN_02355 [Veillonella parvula]|uniref:hypothetical protein n=1 Tax=Veillonella parvula TaxID=29466 RepID=UPI00399622BA
MANNKSNFKNDFNAEKVINEFLRKYFYKKFVDNNIIHRFYHITDSNLQHEGVDTIIVTLTGIEICIDEKAALDYAKKDLGEDSLPTFAFEISYLNRSGILTEGWLTNPKYSKTDDYRLVWLWVKPSTNIKYLQCDDILKLEVIVLPKAVIQNHILYSVSGDIDLESFRRIANRQRAFMLDNGLQKIAIEDALSNADLQESEYAMENFAFSRTNKARMKWYLTNRTKKSEEPLNIVVNKNTLIDLAKSYWIVTPTLCKKEKTKNRS